MEASLNVIGERREEYNAYAEIKVPSEFDFNLPVMKLKNKGDRDYVKTANCSISCYVKFWDNLFFL